MPQFMIIANDFTDGDALQRRLAVREDHLQRMRIEKLHGRFIIGGARLNEEGTMVGSMLIVALENRQAVDAWLKEDPYVIGRVWDEIEVIPFRIAGV